MNETHTCNSCSKQFRISIQPLPPDEKLAFVERVCRLLVESRFGVGRPENLIAKMTDGKADIGRAVFYDLTDEGPVPCYDIGWIHQTLIDSMNAYLNRERRRRRQIGQNGASAVQLNLGRGSPPSRRTPSNTLLFGEY